MKNALIFLGFIGLFTACSTPPVCPPEPTYLVKSILKTYPQPINGKSFLNRHFEYDAQNRIIKDSTRTQDPSGKGIAYCTKFDYSTSGQINTTNITWGGLGFTITSTSNGIINLDANGLDASKTYDAQGYANGVSYTPATLASTWPWVLPTGAKNNDQDANFNYTYSNERTSIGNINIGYKHLGQGSYNEQLTSIGKPGTTVAGYSVVYNYLTLDYLMRRASYTVTETFANGAVQKTNVTINYY